jgi:hypothetical protein
MVCFFGWGGGVIFWALHTKKNSLPFPLVLKVLTLQRRTCQVQKLINRHNAARRSAERIALGVINMLPL